MRHVIKLEDLRKSACARLNPQLFEPMPKRTTEASRIVAKHFKKRSIEKDWLASNLLWWANERAMVLHEEFKFDKNGRKWVFDYCIPAIKCGIEYEGLFSAKSRHTTAKGYTGDAEKYNAAQAQGWRVIRVTALNYKTVLTELNKFL